MKAKNLTSAQVDALQNTSAYVHALRLICIGEVIDRDQLDDLLKPIQEGIDAALEADLAKGGAR